MVIRYFKLNLLSAITFFSCSFKINADTLTVYEAFQLAEQHFPLLKKELLNDNALNLKLINLENAFLPEINAMGSATYQSDVIAFPFTIPGQRPLDLPHERLQAYLDVSQVIYDGGVTKISRELANRENEINKQQVQVSLQQLEERVLNTYFSVVVLRQMEDILQNSYGLLQQKLQLLQNAFEGGIQDQSGVLKIKAEILTLDQKVEEVRQQIGGQIRILSLITGEYIDPSTEFIIPGELNVDSNYDLRRPEIELLSLQQRRLGTMFRLQEAVEQPKIRAFSQGGIGYPNPFNLFNDEISPFGIVGVRFSWNVWDWGNRRREREILLLQSQMLEAEKENLLQNVDVQMQKHVERIEQLKATIVKDLELILVLQEIRELASLQFDEGIISTGDYIDAVHEEQAANLNLALHKIQLELEKASYLNIRGTFFNSSN